MHKRRLEPLDWLNIVAYLKGFILIENHFVMFPSPFDIWSVPKTIVETLIASTLIIKALLQLTLLLNAKHDSMHIHVHVVSMLFSPDNILGGIHHWV